jgi:hypothetical protein
MGGQKRRASEVPEGAQSSMPGVQEEIRELIGTAATSVYCLETK